MTLPNRTTVAELAEWLDVSPDWIWKNVRERNWPHVRAGRTSVTFTEAHVEEILGRLEVRPGPEEEKSPAPRGLTKRSARHLFGDRGA